MPPECRLFEYGLSGVAGEAVQVLQVAAVGAPECVLSVPEVDRFRVLDLAGTTAITRLFHSAHLLWVGLARRFHS
jgi:hypothetical protein